MAVELCNEGADGGARIDWLEAFHYYAALSRERRTYRRVAERFALSARTVERHGLKEEWRKRATQIDADAAEAARAALVSERASKLLDTEKLIDATHVSYAQQLSSGRVKVSPADLGRLHELRKRVWDDAALEAPAAAPAVTEPTPTAEQIRLHKLQVLRALRDAGAFDRLDALAENSSTEQESL